MESKKMSLNDKIINTINIIAVIIMVGSVLAYLILWSKTRTYIPFIGIAGVAVSTLLNLRLLTNGKSDK